MARPHALTRCALSKAAAGLMPGGSFPTVLLAAKMTRTCGRRSEATKRAVRSDRPFVREIAEPYGTLLPGFVEVVVLEVEVAVVVFASLPCLIWPRGPVVVVVVVVVVDVVASPWLDGLLLVLAGLPLEPCVFVVVVLLVLLVVLPNPFLPAMAGEATLVRRATAAMSATDFGIFLILQFGNAASAGTLPTSACIDKDLLG